MNSPSVIVLVNLNAYLGGGETLMVRFAKYLQAKGCEFICVCAHGGYAHADLQRNGIEPDSILPIESSPDYFYAGRAGRRHLVNLIVSRIRSRPARFVSFCMRDLYTVRAVCTRVPLATIVHLILHIQDDLYLGQTILEKIGYRLKGRLRFGSFKAINFNRRLLNEVNENGGLICMAELIANAWHQSFGIVIPSNRIIPLPSFIEIPERAAQEENNRKILWIGRLVDFKIPALLAMVDFLASTNDYRLTVVGAGDRTAFIARMKERDLAPDRVNFVGEVPYAQLGEIISGHSIGYAMGTSLIELAKFQIPVVIALASYTHAPFSRPICGGLFFDQPRGCDGSELSMRSESEIETTIADAIGTIETDWKRVSRACYEYARDNYSSEQNFSEYENVIDNAACISYAEKPIAIPKAPLFRKIIYSLSNRWGK